MNQLALLLIGLSLIIPKCVNGADTEKQKTKDEPYVSQFTVLARELGLRAPDFSSNETIIDICNDVKSHNLLDIKLPKLRFYVEEALREMNETVEIPKKMDRATHLLPYLDCFISASKKRLRDAERLRDFFINARSKQNKSEKAVTSPPQDWTKIISLYDSFVVYAEKQKQHVLDILDTLDNKRSKSGSTKDDTDTKETTKVDENTMQTFLTEGIPFPEPGPMLSPISYKAAIHICKAPKAADARNAFKLENYVTDALHEVYETRRTKKKMYRARQLLPLIDCLIEAYKHIQRNLEHDRELMINDRHDEDEGSELWKVLIDTKTSFIGAHNDFINDAKQLKEEVELSLNAMPREHAINDSNKDHLWQFLTSTRNASAQRDTIPDVAVAKLR